MVSVQQSVQTDVNRRRALSVIAAGFVGCAGAVFYTAFGRSKAAPIKQIACEKVHENLQDFVDDKIADRYLSGMISHHLFICPECQQAYHGMIDGNDFSCGGEKSVS